MPNPEQTIASLGTEPPLVADGRGGPPDKREVSARWLSGTFLTGLTSSILMGVALFAALDGREQLAVRPQTVGPSGLENGQADGDVAKAARLSLPLALARTHDRRRMEVSTVTQLDDRNVVRTLPFVHVKMALAAGHTTSRSYPPFEPLAVFAEDDSVHAASTGVIYGAKVESEVSLRTVDFPVDTAAFEEQSALTADEVESVVRTTGAVLTDGDIQVAALHYIDPQRFGETLSTQALASSYARVVPENVSVAARNGGALFSRDYSEDVVPLPEPVAIADALEGAGHVGSDAAGMAEAVGKLLNSDSFKGDSTLRLGVETRYGQARIMRASLYHGREHILTIALNDRNQFVPASEPEQTPVMAAAFNDNRPVIRPRADLPSAYDGIHRAAFSYGLSGRLTRQLVRLLAADVDFQSRLSPTDELEVFFSQPDEEGNATDESEIIYAKATFGGTTRAFYRFRTEDGAVEYFDEEGRSARQFLLRNPVPSGRFTSGFGSRRHPILGYSRMHTGVDWAAPRGTPIIASGNGVVEKAGWVGGYGRQTIIRHANGYVSSYSHQHAIAQGVAPGARVRQGQVIGYVGSTGLSSGNHLHYELIVNGTKVDPMRVRLPDSRTLRGEEMETFQRDRQRIDALLNEEESPDLRLASHQ